MPTRWNIAAALLAIGAVPHATLAQEASSRERGSILFGAFITDRDTRTRLDSEGGIGTDIDLEDDLGFESTTSVARFGGYYWLAPRHRLDASYFDLSRSVAQPIEETIRFGEQTFAIDTVVASTSDVTIVKADYTYAPVLRERGFLGVTGGLYVAETRLTLDGAGVSEAGGLTAPLPVIGLRGDYQINDRFTLRGAAQWFGVETDEAGGMLREIYLGVDYGFGTRMAIGLAYNLVSMDIEAQDDDGLQGRLDWGYEGSLLYFKLDFGL